jgi:beta-phosphoglucomutase-like phosphatase (HAD superfamily)
MPLRAVVFDFDGVIANSEPLHLRAFQEVLAAADVTLTDREYYGNYLGFDDAGVFRAVDANRGAGWTPADIDALVSRKTARLEALEHGVSMLFPGAADAVRRLAAAVPLAIASGANGTEIRRVLDREQLTSSFVAIVPADDGLAPKPAPDPYLRAVAQLGAARGESIAARDCVAVEDSMWGLRSARTAGLHTVAVTHTYPAAELSEADLIIISLQELTIANLSALFGA